MAARTPELGALAAPMTAIGVLDLQVALSDAADAPDHSVAAHAAAGGAAHDPEAAAATATESLAQLSVPRPPRMAAQSMVLDLLSEGLAGQPSVAEEAKEQADGMPALTPATVAQSQAAYETSAPEEPCSSPASDDGTNSIVDEITSQAGISADSTVVWFFARRNFGSIDQFLEVVARPISILRPGIDMIALPIGHSVIMDLWLWAVENFGYQLWQALWFPLKVEEEADGLLNADVSVVYTKVVESVKSMFRGRLDTVLLVPFQKPRSLVRMCDEAGIKVFGDTFDGLTIKDCLHARPWNGAESVVETHLRHPATGDITKVRVPRGFTCVNSTELRVAYEALTAAGVERIVLKPSWASSGRGIEIGVSAERVAEYTWAEERGSIVLEEFLQADVDETAGATKWPVVHFLAKSVCGEVVEQLIAGTTSYNGTVSPCEISTSVEERVKATAMHLCDIFGFTGFWGIDVLIHKGVPFLIDLNSGRPNGGHVPKIFVSMHAPGQPFKFWKEKHVSPSLTAVALHRKLVDEGLAFTSASKRGLIILHVFPGIIATILAIGKNKEDLKALLSRWQVSCADVLQLPAGGDKSSATAPVDGSHKK